MSGKAFLGRKLLGKLLPRKMLPEDCPLEKSLTDIKNIFTVVNDNLGNIKDWFTANKLSLNAEETKYSFFNKSRKKDYIALHLSKLIIKNYEIQREKSIKLLGILLKQHLTRIEHIKLTENINAKIRRYIVKSKTLFK